MSQSGYTAWNVTAGEVPTTAYWNILGYNDASFNTGNGFNDGILQTRHFADLSVPNSALIGGQYVSSAGFDTIVIGNIRIAWGIPTVSNSGTTVFWPIAFSGLPTVTATIYDANNQTAWVQTITVAGAILKQIYATNPLPVSVIAIGRA